MNKKIIVTFLLIFVIVAGFFTFWYYRDKVFSKEILKLEILGPDNANMGDEIQYTVKYKNNGSFVLQSPKLIFTLPDNSLTEDNKTRLTKDLKDIYPGEEGFVQFKARLLGKEGDVKVAHAWLSYIPHNLSARYESDTAFTTKLDMVPVTLSFDVQKDVQEGTDVTYSINYLSNVDYPLENLSIKLDAISGFTIKSATPTSLDNIEWKLATLQKGQGGKITINGTFAANTPSTANFEAHLGMWQDGSFIVIKDATQDVAVGNSNQDNPPPVTQKPNSHLVISQKTYHKTDENFTNSGPIPPEVGKATSYTITWNISNDLNDVKNVKVSATLPKNVTLTAVAPESQIPFVSSDGASHQIVWSVGSVTAGIGTGANSPVSISFQVTLTPDVLMEGVVAGIIGDATVTGQDTVTENIISNPVPALNTSLVSDSDNPGGGVVK